MASLFYKPCDDSNGLMTRTMC